jgi:ferredoxin-NADP reductase
MTMSTVATRLLGAHVWPRTLDDWLELVAPLHSSFETRARVIDIVPETHDVSTLRLLPNGRWRGHRAGQHVLLGTEIGGVRRARCFSVASAEGEETISLTVKARPGGAVTPVLVSGVKHDEVVTLSEARGSFVLPDVVPPRVLLISGGSGITPVMSMLRTLVTRRYAGEVVFLHYARSPADVIYREELARLGAVVITGPFAANDLATFVPDFDEHDAWVCGPTPFMSAVERAFAERGAASRVRTERFSLSEPSAAGEGEVRFVRSRRTAKGRGPLLALAEAANVNPPSGCRMGVCRTCVCRKVSGTTRDLRTGRLSTEDDVDIQLCINAPVGKVEIDL